jgi:hypothetical protein
MTGQPVIVIARHGEKPEPDGPHGVDHHGHPSGHGLTPRGWARSGALAVRLSHAGGDGDPLPRPTRVYATATDPHHESDRPRMTAHGVAERLGVPMRDHFGRGQEASLATDVLTADEPTLVVWDHGHIPALARSLPLAPDVTVPDEWPDDRFDLFWLLTPSPQGYQLDIVPQLLLAGDAPVA